MVTTKWSLCLIFCLSYSRLVIASPANHVCLPDQRDALLEFKNEFYIPSPDSDYMMFKTKTETWMNNTDCCSWDSVSCDPKTGKVVELDLIGSDLNGPLRFNSSLLVIASPANHVCLPDQRDALLEFKNEFYIPSPDSDYMMFKTKTETWMNNTDCCSWDSVSCDPKTGKVVELDLIGSDLNGPLRFNSSLFRLQHLQSIDLSFSNLSGILPDSIGNLKYLRILSLRYCNLFGKIPSSLGNLTYLSNLDLSYHDFNSKLPYSIGNLKYLRVLNLVNSNLFGKIPSSLGNLTYLSNLDLSYNYFNSELPYSIGNLKYLRVLSLGYCNLVGKIPSSLGNLTYLTNLDISNNDFNGELPYSIGNLIYLRVLNLVNSNLFGKIPSSFGRLSYLTDLDLSYNYFASEGPNSMGRLTDFQLVLLNLSSLVRIDLGSNQFKGMLPSNMSSLSKLESFDINENSFSGPVPSSLFMIPSLIELNLGRNHFIGPLEIVNFFSSQSNISKLYIGENNFSGPIPGSILKLVGLSELSLSFWNTGGDIVDFSIFLHLKSLSSLDLSGIQLNISSTLHLPSSMRNLVLSSCNIDEFPKFLQNHTSLYSLDISSNQIEGQIPEWLWSLPELAYVNIAQNSFSGELTMLPNSTIESFKASDNQFSGEIPRAICEVGTLDLSNNNFSGSIPRCFGVSITSLSILHLRNNSLFGVFPEEIISANLKSLDVGGNQLSGQLPKWLMNCTHLQFLNVEDNRINDKFPFCGVLPSDYFVGWSEMSSVVAKVDFMPRYRVFGDDLDSYLRYVKLTIKGVERELVGSGFKIYKNLDVSGNRLEGDIPESIDSTISVKLDQSPIIGSISKQIIRQ
ncbi:PREDICTED: receptor-like protein 12 [Camelina sativa]|uniref:Receptor-like protein 12 n=1 Tax=Camelina sativa TaxID=90675 RepID=A0ABM0U6G1_CAMSA|nr:PREDICTED: receptor-like protein 12 [Camelina sativa]